MSLPDEMTSAMPPYVVATDGCSLGTSTSRIHLGSGFRNDLKSKPKSLERRSTDRSSKALARSGIVAALYWGGGGG